MRWLLRSLAALRGRHEGLDGESDAFGFKVSAEDLDLDNLAGFDRLGRLLDKAVRELADVDRTVLVDADSNTSIKTDFRPLSQPLFPLFHAVHFE